jgi:hypothetical protein
LAFSRAFRPSAERTNTSQAYLSVIRLLSDSGAETALTPAVTALTAQTKAAQKTAIGPHALWALLCDLYMAKIQTLSIACLVQLAGAMHNIYIDINKLPQTLALGHNETVLQRQYGWTLKKAPGLLIQAGGQSKQQNDPRVIDDKSADPHCSSEQASSGPRAGAQPQWQVHCSG